ncbi:hypothetical protein GCM10009119_29100 [Algoriphagus jejuensis]|uniref:DinB family protein n=2 Tax=Algoriphagus jejuensis TaxID=419934 RepID=A0ABN1N2S3_9BACT
MITYAKGESSHKRQFDYLKTEGVPDASLTTEILLENLDVEIATYLAFASQIDPDSLTDFRGVERAQLPSSVGGLLFHAAEHTQRHFGQLLVTVRILLSN